ncbi:hypothetical protein FRB99_001736 [Tulasnella sp. 403]|nr:hypothetical protein FRB99_001736 [Tulasnella sp. 403]
MASFPSDRSSQRASSPSQDLQSPGSPSSFKNSLSVFAVDLPGPSATTAPSLSKNASRAQPTEFLVSTWSSYAESSTTLNSATYPPPQPSTPTGGSPSPTPSLSASEASGLSRTSTKSLAKNKDDIHVPRPPNSFILFRNDYVARMSKGCKKQKGNPSKKAAAVWSELSEEERRTWAHKAELVKEQHAIDNPGYKYQPGRKKLKGFEKGASPSDTSSSQPLRPSAVHKKVAFSPATAYVNDASTIESRVLHSYSLGSKVPAPHASSRPTPRSVVTTQLPPPLPAGRKPHDTVPHGTTGSVLSQSVPAGTLQTLPLTFAAPVPTYSPTESTHFQLGDVGLLSQSLPADPAMYAYHGEGQKHTPPLSVDSFQQWAAQWQDQSAASSGSSGANVTDHTQVYTASQNVYDLVSPTASDSGVFTGTHHLDHNLVSHIISPSTGLPAAHPPVTSYHTGSGEYYHPDHILTTSVSESAIGPHRRALTRTRSFPAPYQPIDSSRYPGRATISSGSTQSVSTQPWDSAAPTYSFTGSVGDGFTFRTSSGSSSGSCSGSGPSSAATASPPAAQPIEGDVLHGLASSYAESTFTEYLSQAQTQPYQDAHLAGQAVYDLSYQQDSLFSLPIVDAPATIDNNAIVDSFVADASTLQQGYNLPLGDSGMTAPIIDVVFDNTIPAGNTVATLNAYVAQPVEPTVSYAYDQQTLYDVSRTNSSTSQQWFDPRASSSSTATIRAPCHTSQHPQTYSENVPSPHASSPTSTSSFPTMPIPEVPDPNSEYASQPLLGDIGVDLHLAQDLQGYVFPDPNQSTLHHPEYHHSAQNNT